MKDFPYGLERKEIDVIDMLAQGMQMVEIGRALGSCDSDVRLWKRRAKTKMDIEHDVHLVLKAIIEEIIPLPDLKKKKPL